MSSDMELENWRKLWQDAAASTIEPETLEQLRRRVVRETRWAKWSLVAPILVTIGVGGGMILRALRSDEPIDVVLAVETWVFIAVTWVGSLWVARGTWRPLADTTAAFIDVSIRRRQANLRAVKLGVCLYMGQLAAVVFVLAAMSPDGMAPEFPIGAVAVGALGGAGLYYWIRDRQQPVLEHLAALKRQLQSTE